MRKLEDFYLALNPNLPNMVVMDDIGKRVFDLCDGNLTASDIVKEILEKERRSRVSKDELSSFISSMIEADFLSFQPYLPPQKVERTPEKLRQLFFHITRSCNLGCKHCYIEAGKPMENELTADEALKMVEDFAQLGGEQLIVTGGEPFLRRELLHEILEKARDLAIERVSVETNGTLILNEDIEMCKRHNIELGVSLDGATQETNDYVRGLGNYQKTIKAIKRLLKAGVKVKICMTLMKPNVKEVKQMVCLARDLGANLMSFTFVRGVGRAEANEDLLLNLEEIYAAIITSWREAREIGLLTQLEDQFQSLNNLTKMDMCGAGTGRLLVLPNGDIYPCNMFLEFKEFKAGNIREKRLEDIWKDSERLKIFRNLSVLDIEGCKECELKFVYTVCPAEIYRDHKAFSKKPSSCPLYKGVCWILIEELARKMWHE